MSCSDFKATLNVFARQINFKNQRSCETDNVTAGVTMAARAFFNGTYPTAFSLIGQFLGRSDVVLLRYITPQTARVLQFAPTLDHMYSRLHRHDYVYDGVLLGVNDPVRVDFAACDEGAREYVNLILQYRDSNERNSDFGTHPLLFRSPITMCLPHAERLKACLDVLFDMPTRVRYRLHPHLLRSACSVTNQDFERLMTKEPVNLMRSFLANRQLRMTRAQYTIATRHLLSGVWARFGSTTRGLDEMIQFLELLRDFSAAIDERLRDPVHKAMFSRLPRT